jgi:prevent-host-death family protein
MPVLDRVTSSSHDVSMKKTRVTDLKARLSHYLRLVRKGETITVYDRDKPVAEIIPIRIKRRRLTVIEPEPGAPKWSEIPLPPPLPPEVAREIMEDFYRERETER